MCDTFPAEFKKRFLFKSLQIFCYELKHVIYVTHTESKGFRRYSYLQK